MDYSGSPSTNTHYGSIVVVGDKSNDAGAGRPHGERGQQARIPIGREKQRCGVRAGHLHALFPGKVAHSDELVLELRRQRALLALQRSRRGLLLSGQRPEILLVPAQAFLLDLSEGHEVVLDLGKDPLNTKTYTGTFAPSLTNLVKSLRTTLPAKCRLSRSSRPVSGVLISEVIGERPVDSHFHALLLDAGFDILQDEAVG